MKFTLLLSLVFAVLISGGCYSANKKEAATEKKAGDVFTLSGICPMRANEDKWRKQSVEKMRESRKVPSVDFEFDSIVLAPSSYEVLNKVAEIMSNNRSFKLIVAGHTDEVGSNEYNDWLSSARANAIKSYLSSHGVHPDSIKTYGHGKRVPLVLDDSPDGRACNRRVQFTLTTRDWSAIY